MQKISHYKNDHRCLPYAYGGWIVLFALFLGSKALLDYPTTKIAFNLCFGVMITILILIALYDLMVRSVIKGYEMCEKYMMPKVIDTDKPLTAEEAEILNNRG